MGKLFLGRKGQLAIETLLLYGVVILVVILAISAIIQFGLLRPESLLPDNCQTPAELGCENFLAYRDLGLDVSGFQLEFRNNFGKTIQELTVFVEGTGASKDLIELNCPGTSNKSTTHGNTILVEMVCGDKDKIQVPVGQKLTGDIVARVNLTDSDILRTVQGTIRTTVADWKS